MEPLQPTCHVMGHDGRPLTLADLPSPKTKRWVIRRKAEVVAAVRGGLLSLEEACNLYTLNTDEFKSWEFCIDRYGLAGLRATRTQFYFTSSPRPRRKKTRDLDDGWLARPTHSASIHDPVLTRALVCTSKGRPRGCVRMLGKAMGAALRTRLAAISAAARSPNPGLQPRRM
jgi:hypothetical protein